MYYLYYIILKYNLVIILIFITFLCIIFINISNNYEKSDLESKKEKVLLSVFIFIFTNLLNKAILIFCHKYNNKLTVFGS